MLLSLPVALAIKFLVWLLALAVFLRHLGARLGAVDARRRQMLGAMALGALAGSKLVHALTFPGYFAGAEGAADQLLAWLAGDSAPGALIGGRLGLWLADRVGRGKADADALLMPVLYALTILSVGEFFWALRGGTTGGPAALPWAVDFGDGVARHPVMLYEAAFLGAAIWLQRRTARPMLATGDRSCVFLFAYLAFSVAAGYMKAPFQAVLLADAVLPRARAYAHIMTAEQWACALAMLIILPEAIAALKRGRRSTGGPV